MKKYDIEEIKLLNELITDLEVYYNEFNFEDFEDEEDTYDYEDIEKNIKHIRIAIKSIVERWEI